MMAWMELANLRMILDRMTFASILTFTAQVDIEYETHERKQKKKMKMSQSRNRLLQIPDLN